MPKSHRIGASRRELPKYLFEVRAAWSGGRVDLNTHLYFTFLYFCIRVLCTWRRVTLYSYFVLSSVVDNLVRINSRHCE